MAVREFTVAERFVGTIAGTLPFAASIILDRYFGYAIGAGLWGMFILAWVWAVDSRK